MDANGNIIDKNGKIIGKSYLDKGEQASKDKVIGKVGASRRLAYDKDGNVIGYVDKDGTVRDLIFVTTTQNNTRSLKPIWSQLDEQ